MSNINIKLSEKEIKILISGLRDRESRMFRDSELYKNQGNREAQMDCLKEYHEAEEVKEKLIAVLINEKGE